LVENQNRRPSKWRISARILIFSLLIFSVGNRIAAATDDVSRLRAQLATAEQAEDKPAIIELSRRIVAIAPNDVAAWENVARTQFQMKDFDRCAETLDAWQKAMKQPPAAIEDFRGDLAVERKDYESAERHWLAFLARKPAAADAANMYDKLAEFCANQARWADSAVYEAKAIAAQDSASRRVLHACVLLRLRQWDSAYAEMSKANKIDGTDAEVKKWLPQFERLQGFLPRIKALDAQITKSPNNAGFWLERARLFTLAERPLLALDDCERAMKLQPASMRARIQTAEALIDLKRDADAAKLQISSVLTREGDMHVSEEKLRELAYEDAQILQNHGEAAPFAARAKTLRYLHQYTLALSDARAALTLDDRSVAAHIEAAENLDELEQSKEALVHITKATELNPNDSTAWFHRGILEARRANFPAAIESQTHSLKIHESLEALREREKCKRRIGKIDEADADLKRIRELEPPSRQ
jgi:tetratricopeptide (TPR) repeat protein